MGLTPPTHVFDQTDLERPQQCDCLRAMQVGPFQSGVGLTYGADRIALLRRRRSRCDERENGPSIPMEGWMKGVLQYEEISHFDQLKNHAGLLFGCGSSNQFNRCLRRPDWPLATTFFADDLEMFLEQRAPYPNME